ncbi:biopolymer transporter ExbD [Salinisphaera orenii MK-B5]|uniref:Biopolymer transporter ExbD n=1 Tax=Salinisphaera orenii MK-B5 TaxID=856730 RepID=A0A423PXP0_9GAMM|nr:biopolymer transporter ExbD [Salinisphaera orenii]ROO30376.1 biopolymer transporter ExbD [Salinisphaera orenii MK-B5]
MRFGRNDDTEPRVNLTPLIDVVFILLIFFMVSARFADERVLALELPPAAHAGATKEAHVDVRVTPGGGFEVAGESVAAEALVASLRAQRAQYPDRALRVRADRDARHGAVVRVFDAAAAAGFARVDVATRSQE